MQGCEIAVTSMRERDSSAVSSSSSDQSPSRRTIASQRSIAARKAGSSRSSCRPIAHHCGPCPEQTKASRGRRSADARPSATPARRPPVGEFPQALGQLLLRVGHDPQAVIVMGAAERGVGGDLFE